MIALLLGPFLGLLFGPLDLGQAERDYRAGRYADAYTLFEAALSSPDAPHGAVLYDMGNCAYRRGDHAQAVLYYRRALLRLPLDQEVQWNLRMAERQLGVDTPADGWLRAVEAALLHRYTPGGLLLLLAGLQTIGLLGAVVLRRRRAARTAMALLVLLALAGTARLLCTRWFPPPTHGVVLEGEIELRGEPHAAWAVTRRLRTGELVGIVELSDRWARIVHRRGGGWTERASVGLVE